MSVNSADIIAFAKDCEKRKDEIGFRNAISRSYYGAYHHVLPCLTYGPKDSHQGLIDYLLTVSWKGNESYDKSHLIGLGHALQALKDKRIISDYDLGDTVTELDANTSIKTAEKLISRCHDMLKNQAS